MAAKPIRMDQIRNLLQQKYNGVSIRAMERNTGLSRNTIRNYLRTLEQLGYDPGQALALDDQSLARLCLGGETASRLADPRAEHLAGWIVLHGKDLRKKHVTRQILWEEYRGMYPDGYGYTWFCRHLNEYLGNNEVTMVLDHRPGEKMMADFAGDQLCWTDVDTGEVMPAAVWVCVLPFSSYMYVEATRSQSLADVADCFQHTVEFLGGVTQSVLFDNFKSVVKRADRYEPTFTELMDTMAVHYRCTLMATRIRKPRDKASVETAVNVTYQRIYAKLRNLTFFSLTEINLAITEHLIALNARSFKGRDYSRAELFERYEKPVLITLPEQKLTLWKRAMVKVQKNYHVILGQDMHQYSVPYRYAGKTVKICFTSTQVEVYHDWQRIAVHGRNRSRYGYTTLAQHMPANHRAVHEQRGWNGDYFLTQAQKIGPATHHAIGIMLATRAFPEQTYSACLGVLRLADKFTGQRLEAVCKLLEYSPKSRIASFIPCLRTTEINIYSPNTARIPSPPTTPICAGRIPINKTLNTSPMNTQSTLDQLRQLGLDGMARSYQAILALPVHQHPTAHELLGQLTQHEYEYKRQKRTETYLRLSKLRYASSLEEVSCSPERNLTRDQLSLIASCSWIDKAENLLITGATGSGKSFLACATGHQACLMGYKTMYLNMNRFIEQITLVKLEGSYIKLLNRIEKVPVLILDDFGLQPLQSDIRLALLQILEDRYARKSTVIASQLPVGGWYEYLKDATLADAILDRLTARAQRFELKGKSLRQKE